MDNASLLMPITPDNPTGIDVSFSPEVDAIQEMRREDDPTLDQGEWVAALKSADWSGVLRGCETVLARQSKDLRVAGWLVDARARLLGFPGLADGLELTAGLVGTYWDGLHPLPDEDDGDQEQRIGNLRWLGARVEQLVPAIGLLSHGGRQTTLAAINGARARRLAGSVGGANASPPAEPTATPAEPALTLETVWREVTASGRDAAKARRAAIARALDALVALQAAVDERLADDAPSFATARAALDRAQDELVRLERECGFTVSPTTSGPVPGDADRPSSSSEANAATSAAAREPGLPGRIETRAQAVEQLRLVASFFRATEPHSPVAYLADKAVRWSDMPLHEWLRAVVKDGVSLSQLEDLLGVDKKPEGS